MNGIKIFLIILATVGLVYLFNQGILFWNNYSEIVKFNVLYNKYEYSDMPDSDYIDKTEWDPNDYGFTESNKIRCEYVNFNSNDNGYYQLNINGVMVDSFNNFIKFDLEKKCIDNLFNNKATGTLSNPCWSNPTLCYFLKNKFKI